jgi:hypothetical protein
MAVLQCQHTLFAMRVALDGDLPGLQEQAQLGVKEYFA